MIDVAKQNRKQFYTTVLEYFTLRICGSANNRKRIAFLQIH